MEYCVRYVLLLVLAVLTSTTNSSHTDPKYHQFTDQYGDDLFDVLVSNQDDNRGYWEARQMAKVKIEALGCFRDSIPRALSQLFFNARENFDWNAWPNMSDVINACASHARADGFQVFGIQHYGECWGEPEDARLSKYDRYGPSDKCVQGVGGDWTNYVYRILPEASTCNINGQEYQEGETMDIPNNADFLEDTMCQKCTCHEGAPSNCRLLYHCHLNHKKCEKYIRARGHCCPVCGCYDKGKKVPEGHRWATWLNAEDCRQCVCRDGQAHCSTRKHLCPLCENPIIVEGQCCPLCGTPTTQSWLTVPVPTELPELTLPPFPVFPPEVKRRLLDWLMKRRPEKKKKSYRTVGKTVKQASTHTDKIVFKREEFSRLT